MDEMCKHGQKGKAGLRAGLSPNTARKYIVGGRLPSELEEPRDWRTREDPFEEDWLDLRARLSEAPELETKALFEDLVKRKPDAYQPGQVRTLQRRVKQWRAEEGPPKLIFFPQEHRPGEAMQTDFTWGTELGITIGGEVFRCASRSRWRRCDAEFRRPWCGWVGGHSTTRRTIRRRRPTTCGRASADSTRSTRSWFGTTA